MQDDTLIRLGRIEEKVDGIVSRLDEKIADHERRIRHNEYSTWFGGGIMTAFAAVLAKIGFLHG